MRKLAFSTTVIVTAILAIYIVTIMLPFVQPWWNAAAYDPNDTLSKRHRIADWLVMTNALVGLRRHEVLKKLGPPPPTDKFSYYGLVYHPGFERGLFSIDSEWLVILLDSSGIVVEAKLVRD